MMDIFDPSTLYLWRGAERILALLIGAGCVYLGYRLFWSMRESRSDGEGKIALPGGISIYVSRVGPGVFFALFGTAIVATSVVRPLQLTLPQGSPGASDRSSREVSYLADSAKGGAVDTERGRTLRDLDALAQLTPVLERAARGEAVSLSAASANRLWIALPHVRQMLVISVWDSQQWGDLVAFKDWVQNGDPADPPATLSPAVRRYFEGGG